MTDYKPSGWNSITPRIFAADPEGLVAFIKTVFGASGDYYSNRPAELKIGDSIVMVSGIEEREAASAVLYIYVPNATATWQKAVDAGARSVEEPCDTPYGDRRAIAMDGWGNTWQIATRLSEGR